MMSPSPDHIQCAALEMRPPCVHKEMNLGKLAFCVFSSINRVRGRPQREDLWMTTELRTLLRESTELRLHTSVPV